MKNFKLKVSRGRFSIQAHVQEMGRDVLVSLWGGDRPHIGAIGMATPRPSLKDPKKWSATSSNFTYVGHKEDSVVKMISERLASRLKTHIVVVAGLHWDNIRPEEIEMIQDLTRKLGDQILNRYGRPT
jgi:gallate decarboxylase subunit D